MEGGDEGFACAEFFAHALEDEDVGIDRHADGEHEAGDAGEGERGTEAGEDRQTDQDVEGHAEHCDAAGDRVVGDHEGGDEGHADVGGEFAAGDRVGGEGRADLVLLFDRQLDVEGVVEDVGEVERFAVGEVARDLGGVVIDLLLDGRGRVELAVEHDGQASETAGALALRGDFTSDGGELLPALLGKHEDDLGLAIHIGAGKCLVDAFAGHFRDAFDEDFFDAGLAPAALVVEGENLIAGRNFARGDAVGGERRVDEAEIETGRFLDGVDDLGVVAGVEAGELDFDAVFTDFADHGLRDAVGVDAGADDLDSLGDFLLTLFEVALGIGLVGRFEGDGDAAVEVEAELEAAFRAQEDFLEDDIVALFEVRERILDVHVREERGEVDLPLFGDLFEGDVFAEGLAVFVQGRGLVDELVELAGFGRGLRLRKTDKRLVLQWLQFEDRPEDDDEAYGQLPEVAFKHG